MYKAAIILFAQSTLVEGQIFKHFFCDTQHQWYNGFHYIWLSETLTNSEKLKDCQSFHPK